MGDAPVLQRLSATLTHRALTTPGSSRVEPLLTGPVLFSAESGALCESAGVLVSLEMELGVMRPDVPVDADPTTRGPGLVRTRRGQFSRWRGSSSLAIAVATVAVLASCSAWGASAPKPDTWDGTKVAFDPANFVDPRLNTNPFHPTKPGQQFVRGGTTEVGSRVVPHEIISTMTDVIRVIDGVPTIAMLDESTDSRDVAQQGMDYLALDKAGNVWILGSYTENYQGGAFTNADGAFLGVGAGQSIGILAPGRVTKTTQRWFIGAPPDEKASVGQPVAVGVRRCVPFGCYDNVRVVQEGNVGAVSNENKYYAPGVGVIDNIPLDKSLHQDHFDLRNLIQLTPAGLAEASQTVLDLEAHARTTAPKVFGSAPASRRAP